MRCVASLKRDGSRCRRVVEPGSTVCDQHNGTAIQVRRRAAERILMTADEAAQRMVQWLNDEGVPMKERVVVARDLMDRAGLAAAQVHKVMPTQEDPLERLFTELASTPGMLLPGVLGPTPAQGDRTGRRSGRL